MRIVPLVMASTPSEVIDAKSSRVRLELENPLKMKLGLDEDDGFRKKMTRIRKMVAFLKLEHIFKRKRRLKKEETVFRRKR